MTQIRPGTLTALLAIAVCGGIHMANGQQQNGSTDVTAKEPVAAELKTKLDTKKAKVGDPVSAKTTAPTQLSNGMSIPKGSMLSGKVSEAQSKAAGNGTASLELIFDQLQAGKNGAPVAIHGVLVGVAPKANLSDAGASSGSLPLGSTHSQATFAGKVGQDVDNTSGGGASVPTGSNVRDVTLAAPDDGKAPGTLTSSKKDFKLDSGAQIAVQLESK